MSSQEITAFPLRPSRVHEASGPMAAGFAAVAAAQMQGHILWVRHKDRAELVNPYRLDRFFDVARLILAQGKDQTEVLAVAEEALRDGAVALVILEISAPLTLTIGRRLQLAALAGGATGLCLIPEGMGSNAAETRWHCAPCPDPDSPPDDSTLQCWKLIKNKSGTMGNWHVRWSPETHRLLVVPPARERPGSAGAPG
jgi:protein ImuA